MKFPTLLFLKISISFCTYGQVESVEPFPEQINQSALNVTSPSMNSAETRLCFKKTLETKDAIMISEKGADGKWSEAYTAAVFKDDDIFQSASISADGNRIYFDLDNDIYTIDYVSDKKWSKPQLLKAVSADEMDCRPYISSDNQTLSFIRNVRTGNPDEPWAFAAFVSKRKGDVWGTPEKVKLELKPDIELQSYYCTGNLCFYTSGSSLYGWGNYYGRPDSAGGLAAVTLIDFNGGFIVWMNETYTTGLVITAATPTKIALVKFNKVLTDQLLLAGKK